MQFSFKFDWDNVQIPESVILARKGKENITFVRSWTMRLVLLATVVVPSLLPIRAAAQSGRSSPVAPRREVVAAVVQEAYDKFKDDKNGKNADYIPYLAQVDSKLFGIAVVTTDNQAIYAG